MCPKLLSSSSGITWHLTGYWSSLQVFKSVFLYILQIGFFNWPVFKFIVSSTVSNTFKAHPVNFFYFTYLHLLLFSSSYTVAMSLIIFPIYSVLIYIFSFKTWSTFIITILQSSSYNSNIYVFSGSVSIIWVFYTFVSHIF